MVYGKKRVTFSRKKRPAHSTHPEPQVEQSSPWATTSASTVNSTEEQSATSLTQVGSVPESLRLGLQVEPPAPSSSPSSPEAQPAASPAGTGTGTITTWRPLPDRSSLTSHPPIQRAPPNPVEHGTIVQRDFRSHDSLHRPPERLQVEDDPVKKWKEYRAVLAEMRAKYSTQKSKDSEGEGEGRGGAGGVVG